MTQDADLGTLFDALDDGSPFDVAGARRALDELSALLVPAVPVGRVEDGTVAGVPVRTYVPGVAEDLVLVWAHGGGWVTGTLDAVDGLTRDALERCVALYAGGADRRDPRLSPLHEPDLTGLPPTAVVVAGRDPLHDEAVAYAARLRAAGVPVRLRCWEEMVHGFPAMGALTPCAGEALAWAAAALREGRAH